jgi:hypothetical protein
MARNTNVASHRTRGKDRVVSKGWQADRLTSPVFEAGQAGLHWSSCARQSLGAVEREGCRHNHVPTSCTERAAAGPERTTELRTRCNITRRRQSGLADPPALLTVRMIDLPENEHQSPRCYLQHTCYGRVSAHGTGRSRKGLTACPAQVEVGKGRTDKVPFPLHHGMSCKMFAPCRPSLLVSDPGAVRMQNFKLWSRATCASRSPPHHQLRLQVAHNQALLLCAGVCHPRPVTSSSGVSVKRSPAKRRIADCPGCAL